MTTLTDIYMHFATPLNPGDPKYLRLNKFIDMVTESGVCDADFGAREIGPLFNVSFITQVNEITLGRHLEMRFIEFCEAFARVADKTMHAHTKDIIVSQQKVGPQNSISIKDTKSKDKTS